MYPDDGYSVNQQQESWRVDRTKVNPQTNSKKHVRLQQKCNTETLWLILVIGYYVWARSKLLIDINDHLTDICNKLRPSITFVMTSSNYYCYYYYKGKYINNCFINKAENKIGSIIIISVTDSLLLSL